MRASEGSPETCVDIVYTTPVLLRKAIGAESATMPPRYTALEFTDFMISRSPLFASLLLYMVVMLSALCFGQQSPPKGDTELARQGVALAQKGRCKDALSILKK